MNDLTFTKTYDIRSYETAPDGRATLSTMGNQLQDSATRHAESMKFGYEDLVKRNRIWVLSRFCLRMDSLPCFGESTDITTWPSANLNTVATRDFLIRQDDQVIGRGVSAWAVIDLATRKATPIEDIIHERAIPQQDRALEFEGRAVKRIREGMHDTAIIARHGDEDINRHVNSIRLVEFLLESSPGQWRTSRTCMGLDVQFRSECHAGEHLTSLCMPQDDGKTALHILKRDSDEREVARMKTWWT